MKLKLSYPDPPSVRLGELDKGDCFILNREFRTEHAEVFMILGSPYSREIKVLSLGTGNVTFCNCNTQVIEMVVEINARPVTRADKEELPF